MKTIKFGVVGTIRGITFIELLQNMGDRACLTAICENAEIGEEYKKKIPDNVPIYANYDEFLNSGIEAVVLTNYFHEHSEFAIEALKKGIHVVSDTTAAPTLGDCVKLCKAVEESNAKYMLGANSSYKKCLRYMKKQLNEGKIGTPFYAEAEYLHYAEGGKPYSDDDMHWRRMMPGTYYNMHTLGAMMFVTGTMPKSISARVVRVGNRAQEKNRLIDHDGSKMLCEMDNGAIFDVTACAYYGPTSKWYRLMGDKGVLESMRYDETKVLFAPSGVHYFPDEPMPPIDIQTPKYSELDMTTKEDYDSFTDEQRKIGHGGTDFWMLIDFIKYINGEKEDVFFDVYRATALSAAGIMAWRSVLDDSKVYEIPNFTKEEDRKKYENDFISPFAEPGSENYITCRAK